MNTTPAHRSRGFTVGSFLALIIIVVVLVASLLLIKIRTVEGNEIGVLETWSDGVSNEPLTPKTYTFFPGFNKSVYTYSTSGQVFTMNDKDDHQEPFANGRRRPGRQLPR